jgi:TolB-like protein/cytochrome c-type biogenesis protein CcmH/NrfG
VSNGLRFGGFEWSSEQRQLLSEGRPVVIGAKAIDLLTVLIDNRNRVVTKRELLEMAWPGAVVEENNLSVQVSALRKILGDNMIATAAGRGYKWTAPIEHASAVAIARRPKPSIGVLPFANLSGSPDQDYFADGLAEDIVASLARSPWIFVVASSSSLQFRDAREPVREIGQKLSVQYLLLGTVRRADARLRVGAELVDCGTGKVVWAEKYDRPYADLFDVQDEIAAKIVGTIEPAYLKQEEKRAAANASRDLHQWDLVMRARWHYWRSSQRHNVEAKRLLEQALRLGPDDVSCLSLLAFSLSTDVWSGWASDAKATALEARRLAMRAVALQDMDAFAHFTLGVTLLGFGELEGAIAEQRRALALYPHFAAAAAELGRLLAFRGETEEGQKLMRQAISDSPTDPRMALWLFGLGIAAFVDGKYSEAAAHARSAITARRDWFFNHLLLATSLANSGNLDLARDALAEAVRLVPSLTIAALRVGHPFKKEADRDLYVGGLRMAGWTQ